MATSVTIATGHRRTESSPDADHNWEALAAIRGTLVFLMAVENLEQIVGQLIANGRAHDEPSAMVQSGTTPNQRVVRAALGDVVAAARDAAIRSPAILVVGSTAALALTLTPGVVPP
jgi:siroheme synthase